MDKLFNRIAELMANGEMYTNPAVTRKEVADALNSNESYIHRAIKQGTGLTFNEYLFCLRLEHACRQLSDPNVQGTIEDIALESGYRSRKTFHQHFHQRYGCTPTQYRQGAGAEFDAAWKPGCSASLPVPVPVPESKIDEVNNK